MRAVHENREARTGWFLAPPIALLAALLFAPVLGASELEPPRARQGYYLSLGAHGAWARAVDSEEGVRAALLGPGGALRVGQALASWFDLGIGFGLSGVFDDDYRVLLGHVSIEAQLRPLDHGFVRLGVGMGFADVTRRRKGIEPLLGRYGEAWRVGVGWDFFPGHQGGSGGLSLTPVAWFEAGPGAEFHTLAAGIGLEIAWWTGLARNELDLPLDEAFAP
jgi:hypothetical protein